jgi:hypothetical protein
LHGSAGGFGIAGAMGIMPSQCCIDVVNYTAQYVASAGLAQLAVGTVAVPGLLLLSQSVCSLYRADTCVEHCCAAAFKIVAGLSVWKVLDWCTYYRVMLVAM